MTGKIHCPRCRETSRIATEKRLNGNSRCENCGYEGPTSGFDFGAPAPAETDAQIIERLRAALAEERAAAVYCLHREGDANHARALELWVSDDMDDLGESILRRATGAAAHQFAEAFEQGVHIEAYRHRGEE